MKRVIITGADGFVGSYTVRKFLDEGIDVLAIGRTENPRRLVEDKKLKYIQCDVSDISEMSKRIPANTYDVFLHFAWAGSAGNGRSDYKLQMQNALNTVACMKWAKRNGCTRFVCAGSIMEYEVEAAVHSQGNRLGMPYIYGMGKQIAHGICKAVAADIGIDLVWALITNAYGVGEFSPRFLNATIRKIINNEPLQFTAATQNYDFVYVTDVADAFYLIAQKGRPFCEYMIGSGNARPLREYILIMQRTLAPEAELLFGNVPYTGTNLPLDVFNIKDTVLDTGYKPKISFEKGVRMTMEWLRIIEGGARHNKMIATPNLLGGAAA